MRSLLKVLGRSALLVGLAVASAWSIRVGYANYWARQTTVSSTNRAIALLPGRADYHFQLALLDSGENPQAVRVALLQAVELNPSDARSWIELGLRYETDGDTGNAEQCLLRAAEADKQYLPRWTLANFYFRKDNMPGFWTWARESAGMIYDNPLPLFRLCGRVAEDGNLIDRLMINRPEVQLSYLNYLLSENRIDLIGLSTRFLLKENRSADVPVLLTACGRLLEKKCTPEALDIWNTLAEERRISFGRLSPAEGTILTNGNFAVSPTSQGFDWRLPAIDGITAATEENQSGLRITFSGSQPETSELLVQLVPVLEKTEYKLRSRYLTSSIPAGAGLSWHIADVDGMSLKNSASLSSEDERQTDVSFVTPAACRLVRLSLIYQRTLGTTRIDGFVVLRSVELKPANQLR